MGPFLLRFLQALWNVVGLLAAAILFLECGVDPLRRLVRRLRPGGKEPGDERARAEAYAGADWAEDYFAELTAAVEVEWAPFVHWWQRPHNGRHLGIDRRGLRVTPGESDDGEDAVRIFCFGGSTMFGMGARDAMTIPAQLQRRLRETGHRVSVSNFGQFGYNSSQEAIALQRLLLAGEAPQLALFFDGFNDIWSAEWSGRADTILSAELRRAEFNLLHEARRRDLAAAALAAVMPRTLRHLRRLTGLSLPGALARPAPAVVAAAELPALAQAVVERYAANLRLTRLLARDHGVALRFFWQPVLTTKRSKTPHEARAEGHLAPSLAARRQLIAAVLEARRRHPELASAVDAIDLSALFDAQAEPLYIDFCHLSEAGNAAVAEAMLPSVAAAVASAGRRG